MSTIIPSGGTLDNLNPEIRIELNSPLWEGMEIRVMRNGIDIGAAVEVFPTYYTFIDTVPGDDYYSYRVKLIIGDDFTESTNYDVDVVTAPVIQPLTVTVFETQMDLPPVFSTCPAVSGTGNFVLHIYLSDTLPSGTYGFLDADSLLVDMGFTITHFQTIATVINFDTIDSPFAYNETTLNYPGTTWTLVRIEAGPTYVPIHQFTTASCAF